MKFRAFGDHRNPIDIQFFISERNHNQLASKYSNVNKNTLNNRLTQLDYCGKIKSMVRFFDLLRHEQSLKD